MSISSLLALVWILTAQLPPIHTSAPKPCNPYRIDCPPSISYAEFSRVMTRHHTLMSVADVRFAYDDGAAWGIDPAWYLAFACKESGCAGDKSPVTYPCHNIGDTVTGNGIPCAANRKYRYYASYDAATDDWYRHMRRGYVDKGTVLIPAIVAHYAPASDGNDPLAYTRQIERWVRIWRAEDRGGK